METLLNTLSRFLLEIFNGISEVLESAVGFFQAAEDFWGFLIEESNKNTFKDEFDGIEVFDLWSIWHDIFAWHLSLSAEVGNDGTKIFSEVLIRVALPVGNSTFDMMENILVVDDNFLTNMDNEGPWAGHRLHSFDEFLDISISTLAVSESMSKFIETISQFVETFLNTLDVFPLKVLDGILEVLESTRGIMEQVNTDGASLAKNPSKTPSNT